MELTQATVEVRRLLFSFLGLRIWGARFPEKKSDFHKKKSENETRCSILHGLLRRYSKIHVEKQVWKSCYFCFFTPFGTSETQKMTEKKKNYRSLTASATWSNRRAAAADVGCCVRTAVHNAGSFEASVRGNADTTRNALKLFSLDALIRPRSSLFLSVDICYGGDVFFFSIPRPKKTVFWVNSKSYPVNELAYGVTIQKKLCCKTRMEFRRFLV